MPTIEPPPLNSKQLNAAGVSYGVWYDYWNTLTAFINDNVGAGGGGGGTDVEFQIDGASSATATEVLDFDGTDFTIVESPANNFDIKLSEERIQDITGAMFSGNTETLVTVTYQDADGTIDVVVDNDLSNYDNSSSGFLTDVTGEALSTLSDVTISAIASGEILKWNGSAWVNNTLVEAGIAATSHTHATTDITSGTFADARIAESNVTQHQAALSITESQISDLAHTTARTDEEITDLAGGMFTGNTETGITATFQDVDNTVDLVVSDTTVAGDTGSTGITPGDTLTIAGGTNITTAMSGDTLTINASGGGSDTFTSVEVDGVTVSTAAPTLDFDGTDFTVTESPADNFDISISDNFLLNTGDVGTGTYDFGGATSLEIPNSSSPTVNADGEIAVDTAVTDFSHGLVKYYSGEEMGVVAMPISEYTSPADGEMIAYNATNDEFELVTAPGGDWVKISSATASSSATIEFTGLSTTYSRYAIVIGALVPATDNVDFWGRMSDDNGSTWKSASGGYAWINHRNTTTTTTITSSVTDTKFIFARLVGNVGSYEKISGILNFTNVAQTTGVPTFDTNLSYANSAGSATQSEGSGYQRNAFGFNGIQLLMSSGNITSGEFILYGIKA